MSAAEASWIKAVERTESLIKENSLSNSATDQVPGGTILQDGRRGLFANNTPGSDTINLPSSPSQASDVGDSFIQPSSTSQEENRQRVFEKYGSSQNKKSKSRPTLYLKPLVT